MPVKDSTLKPFNILGTFSCKNHAESSLKKVLCFESNQYVFIVLLLYFMDFLIPLKQVSWNSTKKYNKVSECNFLNKSKSKVFFT